MLGKIERFINKSLFSKTMGRIKTQMIKRLAFKLLAKHSVELKDNFSDNKKIVQALMTPASKKVRNSVAGYVTRLIKHKELL